MKYYNVNKIKFFIQILFGILFGTGLIIIIIDLTVLRLKEFQLIPDIFVAVTFFTIVFLFLFVSVLSFDKKLKMLIFIGGAILTIVFVVITDSYKYRHTTYNTKDVIEICSSFNGVGQTWSYYYPIHSDWVMSLKPIAKVNYGVILDDSDTVFNKTPLEIVEIQEHRE